MVLTEFGDDGVYDDAERRLVDGEMTLHEVIAWEFSSVRAPLGEVANWVREHVRVREGFHELARRHRPTILSSGFRELIEPVLEREGVDLEVLANELDPRPDGWRAIFRDDAVCDACGEPCKRSALDGGDVVYVGDGVSDHCAALAARRVFARDGLAAYLEREGIAFERFGDLHDVVAALR
jgi:2-hydroxy-3-keto-5-methylthiopentenyl-1-phosphate phosphatase